MGWFRFSIAELYEEYRNLARYINAKLRVLPDIAERLDRIEQRLNAGAGGSVDLTAITERLDEIMANIDRLEQSVTDQITVGDGMATLLGTLSELIRASNPNDPRVAALADKVDAKKTDWAAAVLANTPAAAVEPPIEPAPAEEPVV